LQAAVALLTPVLDWMHSFLNKPDDKEKDVKMPGYCREIIRG
jgi:hypothetical protein